MSICNLSWGDVSAQSFFNTPDVLSVKISPDGKNVASIVNRNDTQHLMLRDVNSNTERSLIDAADFSQGNATIRGADWIDNQHIAIQFSEVKKGIKDLLDTQRYLYLLILELPEKRGDELKILSVRTQGWLIDPLPSQKNTFLYSKSGPYSKIYKLKISELSEHTAKLHKLMKVDGGQFVKANEVASVAGYVTRWFVATNGEPAAALHFVTNGDLLLSRLEKDGGLTTLKRWPQDRENIVEGKNLLPIAMTDNANIFYCLDFSEEEERSVYQVDFSIGEEKLIFEADSFKIIDLILSMEDNRFLGVEVLRDGDIRRIYLDDDSKPREAVAENKENGVLRSVVGRSLDRKKSIIYVESHDQPGRYWLKDNLTGRKTSIGRVNARLPEKLNSRLIDGSVEVEALKIPYLLSLPGNRPKNKKGYSLIVMPHGGPIGVFDNRYFDSVTQYFVASGYAVLRVNFRGSSGYTQELKDAGKGQWGNLMLEDIYQASRKVVSRDDIDGDRVAIFGMSYGGYAATMSAILHPELYRCAVNVAGVSDLSLYLSSSRFNETQKQWFKEHVGDPVLNYDNLQAISPVYLADKLERPLFIMHGDEDAVVDIEHAYRLKLMLEKYEKPFSWHVFSNTNHNFEDLNVRAMMFSKAKDFIGQHIGG